MKILKKCLALFLAAMLLLAPAAQAITPDQLKGLLQKYYSNDIPQAALDADTVEGILEALNDPYTVYMTEEEYAAFNASMSDTSVVGIGISALEDEKGLLIVGTYEGAPARELGLVAGDIIIQVGDHDAAGETPETITSWIKGKEGTKVSFRVLHADGTEQDYTATRKKVVVPTAATELLENGTTGYIVCDSFGAETLGHVADGVKAYDDANLWIVDLQSNPGGDVYAVTQTLGVFLGKGTMLYLRDGEDQIYSYVSEQEAETLWPVIVLTSEMTASSAEIFSLGIKDQKGGMVIGSNTYGKGVAQVILTGEEEPEVLTDNDAMKITAFQYYGVNGASAQTIGVIPDLLVPAEDAFDVATLFSAVEPKGSGNDGWIQLHLGGCRWYVEIASATKEENMAAFAEMLSAVPPGCDVFLGTGDDWMPITIPALVKKLDVKGFESRWFTDVNGEDCQLAVNTLATYRMLRGYGDGTFRPNHNLTRAEFCAVLAQALNLPETESRGTFSDVPQDSWFASCVQAVADKGLMNGMEGGNFAPNEPVTHEQMITVMGRLSAMLHSSFYFSSKEVPAETGVPDTYSDWAKDWVWLLSYSQTNLLGKRLNILYAEPEDIAPKAPATRGETAQVLYSILTSSQIINY